MQQTAANDRRDSSARSTPQIFTRHRRDLEQVEIREYDFKRPERISKDQIRALQTLHDAFARNFGAALSGFLRTIVEVRVAHVEQMTYSEFIAGLPNPTSFSLLNCPPLDGQMCLEVSPLITFPLIDRLLGGNSCDQFIPQRPLTAIETRLIQQILERGMAALTEAWDGIGEINFNLGEMESNPQLVQIVPPNEVVVVLGFEIKLANGAGTMSLCVPYNVIEPVVDKLSTQNWFQAGRNADSNQWKSRIDANIRRANVELSAVLAETTITLSELRSLEVGDMLTTTQPAAKPISLTIDGCAKHRAHIGQHKGRRAVRILDRGEKPEPQTHNESTSGP